MGRRIRSKKCSVTSDFVIRVHYVKNEKGGSRNNGGKESAAG